MPTTNQDIAKKIDELSEAFIKFSADVSVRLGNVEKQLVKLNDAIYGNGEPGLKEKVREHERVISDVRENGSKPLQDIVGRIKRIEEACEILSKLDDAVEDIERRHAEEDTAAAEAQEQQKAEKNEMRKFKYALALYLFSTAVNVVLAILNIAQ